MKGVILIKIGLKKGFSLVEMMIVMLLIAVVLAASTPMITKRVSRERSDRIFDALSTDPNNAVEYVKGRGQRIFMNGKNNGYVGIVETGVNIPPNSVLFGNNTLSSGSSAATNLVGIGFETSNSANSVAIGSSSSASTNSIAIGTNTQTRADSVALGYNATANMPSTIAIGYNSDSRGSNSIAIGRDSLVPANVSNSVVLGYGAKVLTNNSTAIGAGAYAGGTNSTAIGYGASTTYSNTIVLGNAGTTVHIPGNLIVDKISVLGANRGGYAILRENGALAGKSQFQRLLFPVWSHAGFETDQLHGDNEESWNRHDRSIYFGLVDDASINVGGHIIRSQDGWTKGKKYYDAYKTGLSDRRLKNVGSEFTAGLNELEKLNFYHFTFKKDKDQVPQVGVMAQDLQKVFPQAVTKDDQGWLTIRWDEMFYAAINAIKELNAKVRAIAEDVTTLKATTDKHSETLEAQAKIIEQQQAEIEELTERVEKLEKNKK